MCRCADVLIINGLEFVTTIVPAIKHATVTTIDKAEKRDLWDAIKPILQLYQLRGFQVSEFRGDGQFACLQRILLASGVPNIRICSRDEHESFIERHHRTLQERTRALLFQSSDRYQLKSFPKKIIQGAMRYATFFINALPAPSGISKTLSPAAMMNDYFLDYSKHCRLQFMQYVLIHNESKNNLNPRVSHALNLGPTGDAQGNHLFLNIETNKIVKRLCNKWTVTPMPDNVPGMIHRLATADKMPEGISFNLDIAYDSDDCDDPIGFDDPSYIPNPIDALDLTLSDDVEPIGVTELSDLRDDANNANDVTDANDVNDDDLHSSSINNESLSNDTTDLSNSDDLSHDVDDTAHDNLGNVHGSTCSNEMIHQQNDDTISAPPDAASLATDDDKSGSNEEDGVTIADVAAEMDALYGERNHNYGLRPRSKRSYGHLFSQMGFKAGLKKFGKKAENAVNKEFFQLNAYDCVEPRSDLTAEQRRKALEYIMTIKKKRNGTIKGRGCADGRKQRAYLIKDVDPEILRRLLGARSLATDLDKSKMADYYRSKISEPMNANGLLRLMDMGGGLNKELSNPLYEHKLKDIDLEVLTSWVRELAERGLIARVRGTGHEQIDNKWFSMRMADVHGTLGCLAVAGGSDLEDIRELYTGGLTFEVGSNYDGFEAKEWKRKNLSDPQDCLRMKLLDMLGSEGPQVSDSLCGRLPFPKAQVEAVLQELEMKNLAFS